jgi:hypothetical protein
MEKTMIECTLSGIKKDFANSKSKTKNGLYSSCIHHNVKGFGRKTWVVIVNIDLDYNKHSAEGKSLEDIVEGCIEYLNTPPKSKYGKRRKRKPLYGMFNKEPYRAHLKEKSGEKYIQAMLLVNDRKRSCFWGEGEKVSLRR